MDEASFKTFYEQTSGPLLSYLLRVAGEKSLADDIFQEAYIRILQSDLTDVSGPKLKPYLFATATNLIRDHWRRSKKETLWEADGRGDSASTHQEDQTDLRHTFEDAFDGISAQQRSLLWLAYVEGYDHKEIAAMLKVNEKSVRVMLFRARQKLSGILRTMGVRKEEYQ